MRKEFLCPDDCLNAPTVSDNDPYRLSEMVRIFHRVRRGRVDINIKLLDAISSGRQRPTEEFKDWLLYSELFTGVLSSLHADLSSKHPQLIEEIVSLDQQNEDSIDIDAMRVDALGLAYARRYLGIKDWV